MLRTSSFAAAGALTIRRLALLSCCQKICRWRSLLSPGRCATSSSPPSSQVAKPLQQAVADSAGNLVAVIETSAVRLIRLADVDLAHALGEGEGHTSVVGWRAAHEQFWHSREAHEAPGDPQFTVDDDTLVVAETFRLAQEDKA